MFTRFNPEFISRAAGAIVDSVGRAASPEGVEQAEKFEFSHLLGHIKDSREVEIPFGHLELPQFPPIHVAGLVIDLSPTKHVFFLLLGAVILAAVSIFSARQYRKSLVPGGISNLVESMVVFIRDEVAVSNMGRQGIRYTPYLLTTFFFILIMNLTGLIPYGATATSNIMVTGGLAIVAYIMIQVAAIRAQGVTHYLAHFTGGVHWVLWPIMVPIEILGTLTKAFALCIRLFANMNAGHIVIVSLIGLIFLFRSLAIAPVSVIFALGIYMLELFVAFLQAYVFTMLTALFMALGMQGGHEEHGHAGAH